MQRQLLDLVITSSSDAALVIPAFEDYWCVETTVVHGASAWPVATVQAIHARMKLIPEQDTRAGVWRQLELTADPDLVNRAAWNGGRGALIVGENITPATAGSQTYGRQVTLTAAAGSGATTLQVDEGTRLSAGERVLIDPDGPDTESANLTAVTLNQLTIDTALAKNHPQGTPIHPDDHTAAESVPYIDATVLHEIGHAVDTALGGVTGFTVGLGGWWTGTSFDTWAAAMGNPWATSDGSTISEEDKGKIKEVIEDAVSSGHGAIDLKGLVDDGHPIRRYWDSGVPVIVAAQASLALGDQFYTQARALYAASGRRFSTSRWYNVFQYHNDSITDQRVTDYQLYAPAEFFAEAYTMFYIEAGQPGVTEADYGRRLANSSWRTWIRTNVHERNQAPAGTGSGETPGQATPGGASFGRSGGNPGP